MIWNYRIIKKQGTFGIHRVEYDTKGGLETCTEDVLAPYGESRKELMDDLILMLCAALNPVLKYEDFGNDDA